MPNDIIKSDMLLSALLETLPIPQEPSIVWGLDDFSRLQALMETHPQARVLEILNLRARRAVKFWMKQLGAKLGRRPNRRQRLVYMYGARLRQEKNYPWSKIAQKLDPKGFEKDRKGCIDRVRMGVSALMKVKATKTC